VRFSSPVELGDRRGRAARDLFRQMDWTSSRTNRLGGSHRAGGGRARHMLTISSPKQVVGVAAGRLTPHRCRWEGLRRSQGLNPDATCICKIVRGLFVGAQ